MRSTLRSRSDKFHRLGQRSALAPCLVAGLVLAGCGGGGGSSTAPAPAVTGSSATLLPTYRFALSDLGPAADRLVATTNYNAAPSAEITIDFRIEPTVGTYTFATGELVFEDGAVAVESDVGFGAVVVDFVEPLALLPGAMPASGTVELTIALVGLVELEFLGGDVELRLGSSMPVRLRFTEFETLFDDPASLPVWQRQSAMAWFAIDLLRQIVTLTADAAELIDDALASATRKEANCDAFAGSPPAGALNQGLKTLTWLGSGQIRAGDRFDRQFTSCWDDAPGGRGLLLDGRVELGGLATRASNGALTYLAFEPGALGGLRFAGLRFQGTSEPLPGVYAAPPRRAAELNRGLAVAFAAP